MLQKISNKFLHKPKRSYTESSGIYRLALDVGTEYAKAIVVQRTAGGTWRVVGYGRARQEYADMEGGAVANIGGATTCCRRALDDAATMAEVHPREVTLGIAGEFVKGVVRTVVQARRHPQRPLSVVELRRLGQRARAQALTEARAQIIQDTGLKNIDVELVSSAVVGVKVDGYKVTSPLHFQGRHVEMTVFHTLAPLVHVGSLRTIGENLGLEVTGMVAEPLAVASSSMPPEAYEFGALVIDVGGGTTDVALIKEKAVVATTMIGIGGRAFTKSIAEVENLSMDEAEKVKLAYAAGELPGNKGHAVAEVVEQDLALLQDALLLAFKDVAGADRLPNRIYVCGGGSNLPGLLAMLEDSRWMTERLFERPPQVTVLRPKDVRDIDDPQGLLKDVWGVTPKALACHAALAYDADNESSGSSQIDRMAR